ncbi:MAG: hypothetical protein ACI4VN_04970 [Clostridia bacterium]
MNNKRGIIISIIIVAIILGGIGYYSYYKEKSLHLFTADGKEVDGKQELIDHLKSIENPNEKEKQVLYSVESKIITPGEAEEILGKSYLWKDGVKVEDGHNDLIEHLKSIEDSDEKEKQVKFSVEQNIITKEEAEKILEK